MMAVRGRPEGAGGGLRGAEGAEGARRGRDQRPEPRGHAGFSPQGFKEPAEAAEAEQGSQPPGRGAARGRKRPAPAPAPSGRLSRAELYEPPSSEELNRLKETEDLFHSSLLRLQVRSASPEGPGGGVGGILEGFGGFWGQCQAVSRL